MNVEIGMRNAEKIKFRHPNISYSAFRIPTSEFQKP